VRIPDIRIVQIHVYPRHLHRGMTKYPLHRKGIGTVAKKGNSGGVSQAVRGDIKPYLLTVHLDTP